MFRRALERAGDMGFTPLIGSEFEFYLLTGDTHEPLFEGYQIFNTVRNDYVPTIRRIVEEMPKVGVDIITANCEYAGSQWEINFAPGRGLAGPGQRVHVQERREGDREAGRLPRDVHEQAVGGLGGERVPHAPLAPDADSGENAFADEDDPKG